MKNPLVPALIAGVVLIAGIRLARPGLVGAVGAAAVAVIVVLLLGLYYSKKAEIKPRDRAADDLYYLGLLLTLGSLIWALVWLFVLPDASDGDVQVRVNELIGYFGIALVSTVAGILGRILLQDSRPDESASWIESVPDNGTPLTLATREAFPQMMQLRRELREAVDAFAHFTRITLSHADHTKSHTQELLEDFNQHMAAVAARGLEDTGAAWQRVGAAMRKDGEALLRRFEEAGVGAASRTEDIWRGLVERIESASAAARERMEADKEEMGSTLTRLATVNGSLASLADALNDAHKGVSALAANASSATAALNDTTAQVIAAQRTLVENTNASQASVLKSLEATAAALTDVVGQTVTEQTRAWRKAMEDFDAARDAQQHQVEDTIATAQRALSAVVTTLNTALAGLGDAKQDIAALAKSASDAATDAATRTNEVLNALATLTEGARLQQEASLRSWHEAVSRLSKEAREHVASEITAWRELRETLTRSHAKPEEPPQTGRPGLGRWLGGRSRSANRGLR